MQYYGVCLYIYIEAIISSCSSSMYSGFVDNSMQVQINKHVATVTTIVRTIDILILAMKAIKGIMSKAYWLNVDSNVERWLNYCTVAL